MGLYSRFILPRCIFAHTNCARLETCIRLACQQLEQGSYYMENRESTPHRNNSYDAKGTLRRTIILDNRIDCLDRCRFWLTQIDTELMEIQPDQKFMAYCINKIIQRLTENFLEQKT